MTITEAVVAVMVVSICVGMPVMGLTLRFALKPVLDAWLATKTGRTNETAELEALRTRVAALEAVWEHRLGAGTLDSVMPPALRERTRS